MYHNTDHWDCTQYICTVCGEDIADCYCLTDGEEWDDTELNKDSE